MTHAEKKKTIITVFLLIPLDQGTVNMMRGMIKSYQPDINLSDDFKEGDLKFYDGFINAVEQLSNDAIQGIYENPVFQKLYEIVQVYIEMAEKQEPGFFAKQIEEKNVQALVKKKEELIRSIQEEDKQVLESIRNSLK